ncbi:trypsin-like peptidase domain-containing protein [Actinoplanes sp. NPDC023714]|uniref:S1C family serine protease n=1 Tax=Actinoplanes sp. NPDC023714 TaxID=3154322 RepID=UPI0033C6C27D
MITGLGGPPRGPEFVSAGLSHDTPPVHGESATVPPTRTSRRWPLLAAAGLAIAGISAGTGGAAGYLAGRPTTATAPPPGTDGDLMAAAARTIPGVVSVRARTGGGSGFVFDDRGHVITNNHVVSGAGGTVGVVGSDGRRLTAEVVGTDPATDIAVLRISPGATLPPLRLAEPGTTRVGEPVLAVGSPLGLSGTVTAGIVSALDRQVRLGATTRQRAVQTDASINPGNSGGPLVNARGEVVGVNTAIATLEGGGSIGIGFAVPIDEARRVAAGIIGRG